MKTKEMTISEIENLTSETIKPYVLEHHIIKDHDCFICDFGGYFGLSICVFKNGKHIYHVNDYQLHHNHKFKTEGVNGLILYYLESMKTKLFTDAELLEPCKSYDEYELKNHFLRNYWIMRYDHETMFFIGSDAEREERKKRIEKEYPVFNPVCFCYVKDKQIVEDAKRYLESLNNSFQALQDDLETFRRMIRKELANHEACITCSYDDALEALGLTFDSLSTDKQNIVKEELRKQIMSDY